MGGAYAQAATVATGQVAASAVTAPFRDAWEFGTAAREYMAGERSGWDLAYTGLALTADVLGLYAAARPAIRAERAAQAQGLCFEAGTLVVTARGSVPIETVQIGDLVLAVDPATGVMGYFAVTELFSRHVNSLVEVWIGDDLIRATEEHPFWVSGAGWVGAEALRPGDCVQTAEGNCKLVASVQKVATDTQVYNFAVAEVHTYFVSKDGYLVHNECRGPSESQVWRDLKSYKGKTRTNGLSGKQAQYYEWDYTHNDIEVYDSKGRHIGSMDPMTGEMTKPPVSGRRLGR
jgi:hypothetical protein